MGAAKSGQLKRSLIGQRSPPVQLTFSRCRQLRYPRQLAISNLAQGSSLFLFQPPPDTPLAATRHSSECNHIHNECSSPLILSPVSSSRTSILYPSVAPGRQKSQLLTQNLQFQPLNPRPFLQARYATPPQPNPIDPVKRSSAQHPPERSSYTVPCLAMQSANSSILQRRHRSPHPPQVGPNRIQGYSREHRLIHERAAARHRGVHRRQAHRSTGSRSDPVCEASFTPAHRNQIANRDRCNNILWMGSADAVEMTDMELK